MWIDLSKLTSHWLRQSLQWWQVLRTTDLGYICDKETARPSAKLLGCPSHPAVPCCLFFIGSLSANRQRDLIADQRDCTVFIVRTVSSLEEQYGLKSSLQKAELCLYLSEVTQLGNDSSHHASAIAVIAKHCRGRVQNTTSKPVNMLKKHVARCTCYVSAPVWKC